jgi:hypothetical protein
MPKEVGGAAGLLVELADEFGCGCLASELVSLAGPEVEALRVALRARPAR